MNDEDVDCDIGVCLFNVEMNGWDLQIGTPFQSQRRGSSQVKPSFRIGNDDEDWIFATPIALRLRVRSWQTIPDFEA